MGHPQLTQHGHLGWNDTVTLWSSPQNSCENKYHTGVSLYFHHGRGTKETGEGQVRGSEEGKESNPARDFKRLNPELLLVRAIRRNRMQELCYTHRIQFSCLAFLCHHGASEAKFLVYLYLLCLISFCCPSMLSIVYLPALTEALLENICRDAECRLHDRLLFPHQPLLL